MAAKSGLVRAGSNRSGLLVGALTYFMWGLFPFYFVLVEPAGPFEVVAFRITFSMLFCVVLVTLTRGWRSLLNVARNPRTLGALGMASVLITADLTIYISAVFTNNTAEASLGYFINPLVSTLLGVLVLKEQLTPAQWVAAGLGLVAVIVISVGYGRLPLFGLGLAFSFGLYGLAKNRVGGKVKPIEGLALETAWMTPAAVVFLSVMAGMGLLTFPKLGWGFTGLLMLSGVITAIPLLTFAVVGVRVGGLALASGGPRGGRLRRPGHGVHRGRVGFRRADVRNPMGWFRFGVGRGCRVDGRCGMAGPRDASPSAHRGPRRFRGGGAWRSGSGLVKTAQQPHSRLGINMKEPRGAVTHPAAPS